MWSNMSDCSRSCDRGTKSRERSCTNPAPKNDGTPCEGSSTEVEECYEMKCPGPGKFLFAFIVH